jgi:transposase-like protein
VAIVTAELQAKFPKLAACLDDARDDVLAFMRFSEKHTARSSHQRTRWKALMPKSSVELTLSVSSRTKRAIVRACGLGGR